MSDDVFHSLVLEFDTDDSEFVRGVEIGRLWEQAKSEDEVEQTIHVSNAEMAMRIAEAAGRKFRADRVDDTWIELWMGEAP